ncbi:hypothetical protein [Hylemonella gracilis]|uniref:hypothetical protein n=1 Tax=Hylemonella gracilis TaxID=80880 RepID=UPI0013F15FF1|nr:hypothetical protein [Hylemonella gracilis]
MLAALGIGLMYLKWEKHEHIPEWIQAGGSVLAIIGAFWIGDATRRAEQLEKSQAIGAVVQAAQDFSAQIRKVIQQSDAETGVDANIHNIYHRQVTNALADALSNIPMHELRSSEAVQAVLYLHVQFAHFLPKVIEDFIAEPHNHPEFKKQWAAYDDLAMPERLQKQKKLREDQFQLLDSNLSRRLDNIDRKCSECLRALKV